MTDLTDRIVKSKWLTPVSITLFILLWEGVSRLTDALFFPSPSAVVDAWLGLAISGELGTAAQESLVALGVGFGAALIVGLVVGSAMGLSRTARNGLELYVNTLMAAPLIALIPLIALTVGLDVMARAVVVFLFAVFVIIVSTEAAMRGVDKRLVEMANSFGMGRKRVFFHVLLPGALPGIFEGVRLGVIRAISGMVTAEIFMALTGLGAMMSFYGSQFQAPELFAVILSVVVVAAGAGAAMSAASRRISRWQLGLRQV